MFKFNCGGACVPADPAAETVKINMPPVLTEQAEEDACCEARRREEREEARREEARREEQLLQEQEEQAAEQRRLEQMQWEFEQAEERRRGEREEAEERRRRELQEAEEGKRRALEEAERRQEGVARVARERERKALVAAFLKEHGYSGASTPKRTMLKTKYPIHTAAKAGDARVVAALMKEGASALQKDSSGHTPAQVALQRDKNGSHADVLRALGGA